MTIGRQTVILPIAKLTAQDKREIEQFVTQNSSLDRHYVHSELLAHEDRDVVLVTEAGTIKLLLSAKHVKGVKNAFYWSELVKERHWSHPNITYLFYLYMRSKEGLVGMFLKPKYCVALCYNPRIYALFPRFIPIYSRLDNNCTHRHFEEAIALVGYTFDVNSRFWGAFYNTTFFTVVCVVIEVVIGVAMALIMNKAFRAKGLIRASILVPWAIPTVVSALLWRWIFDANGVANNIINQQILWSTDGWQAKAAVVLADTWKTAPFIGLLTLAGLQVIPEEVYEAARLDGANAVKQFWHITLPLVRPALLVAVLFRILDNLRMFDLPAVLIGFQKPSVETVSILAFLENGNTRFGPAAAYAVVLFLYIVLVAFAFVKLLGADVIGDAREKKPPKVKGQRRMAGPVARGDLP